MGMLATKKNMGGVGDDFVCDEGLRKEGENEIRNRSKGTEWDYHVAES